MKRRIPRWHHGLWLTLLCLMAACGNGSLVRDSYDLPTLTAPAVPTATPTSVPAGSEGVGLTFYKAWEAGDYLGMYSLLSPQSQALLDAAAFTLRYTDALDVARVQEIRIQPLSARQDGARAELAVRVTWESAVVGPIIRDQLMELVFSQGRWGVAWDESLILPELKGGLRLAMEYRLPARANIYDREGRGLAFQGSAITLGVVPGRIRDEPALLAALSQVMGRSHEAIRTAYATALPDWYVPLGDIPSEVMQANLTLLSPFLESGGLVSQERLSRLYNADGVAAHVVGYTAPIPAERLDEYEALGYRGDEVVGATGIEAWGEDYLNGVRGGALWVVTNSGDRVTLVQEAAARQARSVYLSLERDFQRAMEEALAQAVTSHPVAPAAAAVVMDVQSGAILGLVSYPGYHPGIFDPLRPNASIELGAVLTDARKPLVNRVTQGLYPAASVFKIVTMAAGLESGLYTPETRYTCTGVWDGLGPNLIKNDWLPPPGHGSITLRQALTRSCNPYFFEIGFNLDGLDPFYLPDMARHMGLGVATGIVGLTEAVGQIPDPDWKLANLGEGWGRGDTVNMATGQGFVAVTPLQVVTMVGAVANGGLMLEPRLVDRIGAGGGAPEESWPAIQRYRLSINPENLAVIRDSMDKVTSDSSGTAAHMFRGLAVPTAGKTGTGENPGTPHAWFAGYAPAGPYTTLDGRALDGPEIAIVVLGENAGEGSAFAAPIFRRLIELYYGITPVTPYPWG